MDVYVSDVKYKYIMRTCEMLVGISISKVIILRKKLKHLLLYFHVKAELGMC